ncbi:bifunctional phosphopantothenoylcysteine decarboxylase/phosphopantothenate--cysteine ligase CoaBC [Hydromonas duriensis]|uniref:Coenzyme A biosynthesis bifunctional protein CoaBC n=1 Tax=Hydromonas duriensis TaxID=1527608 RepID=A0A4R6Y1Z2_9BURK|nr:bifunctional phosphopantothenoylcysteine decarboxylase/phosphopantothenate--cysteine ligase CoaBC [Hydromonas duriensis]TDR30513.1 phosphopantothenate-cysteine ligase /phosphopantothenoylcysteine decarboxylase [Hydromonas duriensis]
MLQGKHIVLGITGGIAAYKSAQLTRLLKKRGARVSVVMTESAKQFITPLTFASLTGDAVYDDLWQNRSSADSNITHINLTREADAMLIAPCTANTMAKIAHGMADDLLTNLVLARDSSRCPLAIAPAMNMQMWANPATQRNLKLIKHDGIHVFGPASGEQACGEVGDGRMLEAAELAQAIESLFVTQSLKGKKVLITAGPTFEAIDPVRGLTNRSSGKMGYALAHAAACAGAQVTLVSGPTHLDTPFQVTRVDVESAQGMLDACLQYSSQSDIFIAVAAVADWRTANVATHKIKKQDDNDVPMLTFVQNPDILQTIASRNNPPYCVGFAAETEHLIEFGQRKRLKKGIPLLIANNGPAAFGADDNQVVLLDDAGIHELPKQSKISLAHTLVAEIAQRLN